MIFVGILLAIKMYGGNDLSITFPDNSKLEGNVKESIVNNSENALFFLTRVSKKNKTNDHELLITGQNLSENLFSENGKLDLLGLEQNNYTNTFNITYKRKEVDDLRKKIATFRRCAHLALDMDISNVEKNRKEKYEELLNKKTYTAGDIKYILDELPILKKRYDNSSGLIKFSCTLVAGVLMPVMAMLFYDAKHNNWSKSYLSCFGGSAVAFLFFMYIAVTQ